MSDLFELMRYLLDKNIVRYVLQGLLYGQIRSLSALEFSSLSFLQRAERYQARLFISWASFRVLRQLQRFDEVHIFLDSVETLFPARYYVRWARRPVLGRTRGAAVFSVGARPRSRRLAAVRLDEPAQDNARVETARIRQDDLAGLVRHLFSSSRFRRPTSRPESRI